jgi:sodium/proline symporter
MNGEFQINYTEVAIFIVYIVIMMAFGVYFFVKYKGGGEKEYFLGGREMGPWVSALSAGTSDMSAWVLMGLPGAIYWSGMSSVWIAIGLAVGYVLSWIFVAPRLRQFSIVAKDSITLPQFFTNRFATDNKVLQCICAVVFLVAFAAYSAAHIKVCGVLFNLVFGITEQNGMLIGAVLIVFYTFLGGFKGVSVSDFFQGSLMLVALMAAPFFALFAIEPGAFAAAGSANYVSSPNYWSLLSSGQLDWASWADILTGIGWGLGYFGMPHIIVRYMAIRKQSEVKKSAIIAVAWTTLILIAAVAVGLLGRVHFGETIGQAARETVFITMARTLFPAIISGVLLSAILSAAMSSTDSKLLVSSSAFVADIYKPILRKNAKEKEMIWIGRLVVLIISIVATILALDPERNTIMGIVGDAWGVFGAAFGPSMLLALYWKRFNLPGAIAGITSGTAVAVLWIAVPVLSGTGLYAIVPAFFVSLIAAVTVTLATKKPSAEVEKLFEDALALKD